MSKQVPLKTILMWGCVFAAGVVCWSATAQDFSVPAGDLRRALDVYRSQTGIALVVSSEAIKGVQSSGAKGDLSPDGALSRILSGTGFTAHRDTSGIVAVVRENQSNLDVQPIQIAQAPPPRAAAETVTVTSSKLGGADVQSIPISITALSQEQLTASQTAGGPDLIKSVPNMTFTKTNFTGYSINIRGIGTQAISVTTDPAVAVAMNDTPFIRNHFFEQEFYDVAQVEVLRGPQGTLYGRNATAGVVNLTTAKPTDQFEAMASGEIGNYQQRRLEGMVNLPIVDDRLDIRVAGEWTKRQGYSFNEDTDSRIDGRDLWSGRVSIGLKPVENLQMYLVWEHFSEDDDRMRTAKQLCKTDPGLSNVGGQAIPDPRNANDFFLGIAFSITQATLSQGCLPASLYSPESFEVPNGYTLPYVTAAGVANVLNVKINPYVSSVQSQNLRAIQTQIDPIYKSKNDTVELNSDYSITPALTFTSQTGFNHDFLWSTEDYNRFDSSPGIFIQGTGVGLQNKTLVTPDGYFCDPQLGCSNKIIVQDLSEEHAWQLSQEFRLASKFGGPLNFSAGGNYMHYETAENYYVFSNAFTMFAASSATGQLNVPWMPGVTDNHQCLARNFPGAVPGGTQGHQYNNPLLGAGQPTSVCYAIDPNPLTSLNDEGHNYFLSQNPYVLNSYAAFGEVYYDLFKDVKLTGGLRWTEDRKHFTDIPSELLAEGYGYASIADIDQQWDELTGRAAINWTPHLSFTDQTLVYGSYAHGYKAGGANPPGAPLYAYGVGVQGIPTHPLTFKPEFIDAFELGSKNTLLDGALTLNASGFYYNYENYQISEIVDRTSINLNFDAHIEGAELEASYEPIPGLRFNFAGGYEHTELAKGSQSVDLMDRTAGNTDWVVYKPFVSQSSNCILPAYVVAAMMQANSVIHFGEGNPFVSACGAAYSAGADPLTGLSYVANPKVGKTLGYTTGLTQPGGAIGYVGFDPLSVDPAAPANVNNGLGLPPNNGAGFNKNLSGNELPNAPPLTVSAGAQYTVPITENWAGTLRADYYWQDYSWSRVFNDDPYDRLRGYTNVNLTLILTSQSGWQVMLYDKNVFNTTAITGTFLNSDDSGLTTNVFLTDPKLIGVRVTKNW